MPLPQPSGLLAAVSRIEKIRIIIYTRESRKREREGKVKKKLEICNEAISSGDIVSNKDGNNYDNKNEG